MTTRNFDALFAPSAIALIGASNRAGSVGAVIARNLFESGFRGPIMPVNPHEDAIRSTINYRSVADLPTVPDLAVIATPPATVPGLIAELGAHGCRAAIVVTAGFGEGERVDGEALKQAMLDAARPSLLRIVGPNCLGFISPAAGINASFAHLTPPAGDLAFVTQSGALATAVLDWATARGIGFSHVASLGSMSDIDFGDMLDYLALDRATRAILLYVESVTDARKFMTAGRIAARSKPVVVIKAGRSSAGAHAALSHTGALAGSDVVYDAAFRRAGMLRVYELRELFEAVTTLAAGVRPRGSKLAILTNGGGAGVLAADALEDFGGTLAELSPKTIETLDAALPPTWSRGNPVDILGDATGERYKAALEALLADPASDAILVMNCPTAVADSLEAARAVLEIVPQAAAHADPHLLARRDGRGRVAKALRGQAPPHLRDAERSGAGVGASGELQAQPGSSPGDAARRPPAGRGGGRWRRVPSPSRRSMRSGRCSASRRRSSSWRFSAFPWSRPWWRPAAEDARAKAATIGGPVVAEDPVARHHPQVRRRRRAPRSSARPRQSALPPPRCWRRVAERVPDARIAGFSVQPMVHPPARAMSWCVGIGKDATFGPVLLFGQGGTAVEVIGDRAIGLPPLNLVLAREMISRTRVSKLLSGYRDHPPADIEAIAHDAGEAFGAAHRGPGGRRARHQSAACRPRRRDRARCARRRAAGEGRAPPSPGDRALSGGAGARRRAR